MSDRPKAVVSEPILRLERVGKSFSGVRVLDDVSLDLRSGEVHVLAGENGAGKSTLLKILTGVHADYEGEIRLDGKPVRFHTPHDATRHGISAIHQELSLVPSMNVVDNLFLGREQVGGGIWMNDRLQRERARAQLQELGLNVDLSEPVGTYPLSVQQLIEIAKALTFDARILVMDEPTSALNEPEVERLFDRIRRLQARGCAILYISHRLEEIYRLGTRISVLRNGKLVGTAAATELPSSELIRWMVGRELHQQFPERTGSEGAELLCVRGFTLSHPRGGPPLVDQASLSVRTGEIVGMAGLQASGGSEFLEGLFGSRGPLPAADVALAGKAFEIRSPRRSIQQGMALLTRDRKETGLIPPMDVCRNVTLASLGRFSRGGWLRADREEAAARERTEHLDLRAASLQQEVSLLSGGNQQKVLLARWLETEPKLLLLDEPTRGVDVGAKHEIYEQMNRWTSAGMGILFLSSDLIELLAMSDRIVVFHRGRITAIFPRAEATQERILHAAMGEAA